MSAGIYSEPTESRLFSHLACPNPKLQASVVIPARDEAHCLPQTLAALAAQRDLDGSTLDPNRFEVLLLCNNCRDNSARIARNWAKNQRGLVLHVVEARFNKIGQNVGHARRVLMDAAFARLQSLPPSSGPRAICSTDADSRVFPTWIAATLAEIAAGAEAVGGRILVADSSGSPRAAYLRDTAYRLYGARLETLFDPQSANPWPRHFQFFGASLALTPRAYEAVGGLPRVANLEDMQLERALRRADVALRHSPHVRVWTSARQNGRVALGLSTQLQEWAKAGAQNRVWLVPSGREIAFRLRARRTLRGLYNRAASNDICRAEIEIFARNLRLNPRWLEVRLQRTPTFGALWDDIERALSANPLYRAQWPPVPVECAIAELRNLLEGADEK